MLQVRGQLGAVAPLVSGVSTVGGMVCWKWRKKRAIAKRTLNFPKWAIDSIGHARVNREDCVCVCVLKAMSYRLC